MSSKKERVKAFLREHPDFTAEEVAKRLGVSISTVRRAMKELEMEEEEVEGMGIEDPFEEEVKKLKEKVGAEVREEGEEELEEAEIEPEILEFLRFLRTYISMTTRKYNFIKKLLINEGVSILRRPNDLEEILCDIAGLSRTRVRAVLKRWYAKKSQEQAEEIYPPYYPAQTGAPYYEEVVPPSTGIPQPPGQPVQQQYYGYPQYASDTDILKRMIAEAIDRMSAAMMFQIMGQLATGRGNMMVTLDERGRPVFQPASTRPSVTMDDVKSVVKEAMREVLSAVDEKIKAIINYVQQKSQPQDNTSAQMMLEMMRMMNEQIKVLMAQNQKSDAADKMFDRMIRMMEIMSKRGGEESSIWREVVNILRKEREQQMSPMDLLSKAIDLVERKILHKEKTSELDVKMAEVEAQREIAKEKLELEKLKMEKETEKDLRMAELLKDLIDSIGKDVAERLIEKVPDVVAGFVEGMRKKKEIGEFPAEAFKKIPTEHLVEAKKVLEEAAPEAPERSEIEEILKKVDEELARREKVAEEKTGGTSEGSVDVSIMEEGQ